MQSIHPLEEQSRAEVSVSAKGEGAASQLVHPAARRGGLIRQTRG